MTILLGTFEMCGIVGRWIKVNKIKGEIVKYIVSWNNEIISIEITGGATTEGGRPANLALL